MSKNDFVVREKNKLFARLILDTTIFVLNTIQLLSKVEQDLQNTNLKKTIKIIEECYNLEKMVNALPEDIFKTNLKQVFSIELPKYICFTIDEYSQINCLDFYNNYIKRKEVHAQILKTVKKQEGGMGMMLTAAFTALAIIHASTASVFNSDKFVDQQLAKRGIDPNANESPSFFNSAKETVLSVFGKSEPNPAVLSAAEVKRYNELEFNYAGKCAYLAYIAELCTGGCPTEEEWLKRDPNIVNEIINSQSLKDETPLNQELFIQKKYKDFRSSYAAGSPHMIGVGLATTGLGPVHATDVPVESQRDPEWFKEYFFFGDTNYKKGEKSDVAIATIFIPGHALNMLYNRNTQKLCIHEVDNEAVFILRKPSYICEEGFFTNEQLNKLAKVSKIMPVVKVVEDGTNIIHAYEQIMQSFFQINYITPSEKIFIHDNENNSGNINEYINIHQKVNDMIIQGQHEAFRIMKTNEQKWMLDPDVVDAWGVLVGNTEKILEDPANVKQHFQERQFLSDYATAAFRKNSRYDEPEKYGGKRKTKQRNRKSRRSRTFKKKRR
jgi:hypothetical protein